MDEITVTSNIMLNPKAMEIIKETALIMSEGRTTVPKHLQGSHADCMAICLQAAQWGMNPFAVGQKTHLVNGTLGYEAQLVNAVVSSSRAIKGRFHYEYGGQWPRGTDAWVRVGAVISGEDEMQWGEKLYPSEVTTRNSPLWKTAPKQQAGYLAVKYWARTYCPAVILGVYSPDELEEPEEIDITEKSETLSDKLNSLKEVVSETVETVVEQPELDENAVFEQYKANILNSNKKSLNKVGQSLREENRLTLEQISALRDLYAEKMAAG